MNNSSGSGRSSDNFSVGDGSSSHYSSGGGGSKWGNHKFRNRSNIPDATWLMT